MRLLIFLYRMQRTATFIRRIFGYNAYFCSIQPQTESTSPFLNIIIFQKMAIFGAPSSTLGGNRRMRALTFLCGIQKESISYIYN